MKPAEEMWLPMGRTGIGWWHWGDFLVEAHVLMTEDGKPMAISVQFRSARNYRENPIRPRRGRGIRGDE